MPEGHGTQRTEGRDVKRVALIPVLVRTSYEQCNRMLCGGWVNFFLGNMQGAHLSASL